MGAWACTHAHSNRLVRQREGFGCFHTRAVFLCSETNDWFNRFSRFVYFAKHAKLIWNNLQRTLSCFILAWTSHSEKCSMLVSWRSISVSQTRMLSRAVSNSSLWLMKCWESRGRHKTRLNVFFIFLSLICWFYQILKLHIIHTQIRGCLTECCRPQSLTAQCMTMLPWACVGWLPPSSAGCPIVCSHHAPCPWVGTRSLCGSRGPDGGTVCWWAPVGSDTPVPDAGRPVSRKRKTLLLKSNSIRNTEKKNYKSHTNLTCKPFFSSTH